MSDPLSSAPTADPVRAFRPAAPQPGTGHVDDEFSTYSVVDFGPLRVPVPPDADVRMATEDAPFADAVFFDFPHGSIRLSVLAAPRTGGLWPERAEEIAGMQAGIGAQVSSVWGEWGRELHIVDDGEYNWVIGVDGARSMLLGRATWTGEAGWGLVDTMRTMLRLTRVERGDEPMPVRTPLPLRRPGSAVDQASDDPGGYAAVVTMLTPPPPEVDETSEVPPRDRPSAAGSPGARPDPVGPRGPAAGDPSRISARRGALVAAAAVLVVAGSLWITREDPVPVQVAQPAVGTGPGGAVRPPAGAEHPALLGVESPVPGRVEPPVPGRVEPPVPGRTEQGRAEPPVPGRVERPVPARPPALPGTGAIPTGPSAWVRTDPGAAPAPGAAAVPGGRTVDRSGPAAGGRAKRGTVSGRSDPSGGSDSPGRSDSPDVKDPSDDPDSSDRPGSSDRPKPSEPRSSYAPARPELAPPGGPGFGPADGFGGGAYPFGPVGPLAPVAGLAGGLLGATPGR